MITEVCRKHSDELFRTSIIQQTSFWSNVKNRMGFETLAINFKYGEIDSDILVVIQSIDIDRAIAYVPYGPEITPPEEERGAFLEELSECLRSFLPLNCVAIKYDLCWESFWETPPSAFAQEFRMNFNSIYSNFQKCTSNILPSNTVYVELDTTPEGILNRMKPKTRYNILLSERRGVEVKEYGPEFLDTWYSLYCETCIRNGLVIHDRGYFDTILTTNASETESPAEVRLLAALHDGKPLAALFLVITGRRGSYLYGASTSQDRGLMAPYALQWRAMMISKEKGCNEYDMFGIAPKADPAHPMYGLYRFKSGFGGEIYRTMGCWDYIL